MNLSIFSSAWALASAVAVAVLGAVCLIGGRTRPRGAFAFGVFALAWGLMVAAGNIATILPDADAARWFYFGFLGFLILTPFVLVEFAAAQAPRHQRSSMWTTIRICAVGVPLSVAFLLAVQPRLLFVDVATIGGRHLALWGPLYAPLVIVPHYLGFAAALFALQRVLRDAPTPRTAGRIATLLAGLAIYTSFASARYLTFYATGLVLYPITSNDLIHVVLFTGMTGLVVRLGGEWLRSARSTHATDVRVRKAIAAAFLVPLAWGAVEGAVAAAFAPTFLTVGLWRLAAVGVIAYGLARWRLYDLPQRTRAAAANAGGATLAVAGGAAAYGATTLVSATPAVPVVTGLLVFGAALFPSLNFVRRFTTRAVSEAQQEQEIYGQRIDTYRAAIESSLARGTLEEDAEFLAALRERFGLTEAEERVVMYYAKSSVVVARDTDAWGAYERLRLLGEGAAGRTWLSRDRARDRLVVLKEPIEHWQRDPQLRAHVLREARLAARVRHPNVVAVEEVVEHKGAPIIVMEYLEGGSLANLLRARGTLPWKEAVDLTLGVLRGLEAVHAAGIVHRDVKPSNILLATDGTPKVGDFGIALTPPGAGGSSRTIIDVQAAPVAGSLPYMAPEALEGASDRRVDVYGAAAVLHECIYGSPPAANSPVVQRDDVPPALSAALARGLAPRPEDRYASARAFAEDITRIVKP